MQAISRRALRALGQSIARPLPSCTTTPLVITGTQPCAYSNSGSSVSVETMKSPDFKSTAFKGMKSHFPCLQELQERSAVPIKGLTGVYGEQITGFNIFKYDEPFYFKYGGILPEMDIAYEHWGELNEAKDNCIILHTGLSASSHAKSHHLNPSAGWWEKFIGPGAPLDTNKFFIVCANLIGGCFGSSGPSSINPETKREYGSSFPLVTVGDMIRSQFLLLEHLGIKSVHATVGASLGGMQSLQAAAMFPASVGRVVSISGCAQSHPSSIAMRYVQRRILMADPNWNNAAQNGR